MKRIEGGVTAPTGFQAGGVFVGLKHKKKDMAMIYSASPCRAAGVFTTNVVKAAPVLWNRQVVTSGVPCHAVVINSGIANACTGKLGMQYCEETAREVEAVLGCEKGSALVCSTGVIGKQLPMDKICQGIGLLKEAMAEGPEGGHAAAEAIMTTDTKPKEIAVSFSVGGRTATMGGMCKGSGMIHPNMCTMLCFITTDCAISKEMLQKALSDDVVDTFNMISVDGDTSTNDTVLLLANGQAGNPVIETEGEDYDAFCEALHEVMVDLSKKIAGDGEGASALFEVQVIHAETKEQARLLSKSIVTSSLTKAAVFGHDANWGRILCAMGYSGAEFDPEQTDIYFKSEGGCIQIVKDGMAADYSEEEATEILSFPEVTAIADIHAGEEEATAWGCDLTYDYVRINADYRS
ncbi:MAG: bifunctional glutamate N-acetyltransferase/amino-acid acetyltransferase ArgJ [Lachnospiraceae bacterium]|nr:bifunctional glutamate N-acetyltransferase/amino-acid acetyltransferase ArgJ [Lachnospiraceae bacterium]